MVMGTKKEEPLQEKIQKWLDTQGYDTEMKVAASLREVGCDVIQAYYYDDPETKKIERNRYFRQNYKHNWHDLYIFSR
jgi:hypothetical protein